MNEMILKKILYDPFKHLTECYLKKIHKLLELADAK
jgi:hypothetical protein